MAAPGALQVIPDNDQPVDFKGTTRDDAVLKMLQKQKKRRGSCPVNAQVSTYSGPWPCCVFGAAQLRKYKVC